MDESLRVGDDYVELIGAAKSSTPVTDELATILAALKQACPEHAVVSFEFDGKLRAHVDVRKREDALLVQALLPTLGAASFHSVTLGGTPHRPFFHRVSAVVAR